MVQVTATETGELRQGSRRTWCSPPTCPRGGTPLNASLIR